MPSRIPSHNKNTNERRERNAMHKSNQVNSREDTLIAATARIEREAARIQPADIKATESGFQINLGGNHLKPVFADKFGNLRCFCIDQTKYKLCAHVIAVRKFAADAAAQAECEKPFAATLRHGNRKGFDFEKSENFATKREACEWLMREAFDKLQPEGEVTDIFGATCFEITDEFFDLWAEAA